MEQMTDEELKALESRVLDEIVAFELYYRENESLSHEFFVWRLEEVMNRCENEIFERDEGSESLGILTRKHLPALLIKFLKQVKPELLNICGMRLMIGNPELPEEGFPFMKKYGDLIAQMLLEFEKIRMEGMDSDFTSYVRWQLKLIDEGRSVYGLRSRFYPFLTILNIEKTGLEAIDKVREEVAKRVFEQFENSQRQV